MASKLKLTELLYPTSTTPAITINADDTVTFGAPTTTITNLSATSITDSGNLTFTGTGNRIRGDFTNATLASRAFFQTSTTNGATGVGAITNGTGATSNFAAYGWSDPNNAQLTIMSTVGGAESRFTSTFVGTPPSGTYLPMTFYTGGSEAMRIDTSRNVGIGVTPSAWSATFKAMQLSTSSALWASAGAVVLSINNYNDGALNKYIVTGAASRYYQQGGVHVWENAPSGTAGNTISFTQAMTLDSSGNLLVGTTTNKLRLTVSGTVVAGPVLGTASGTAFFANSDPAYGLMFGSTGGGQSWMQVQRTDGSATAYDLWLQPSGGNLLVGTTSSPSGLTSPRVAAVTGNESAFYGVNNAVDSSYVVTLWNKATSGGRRMMRFNAGSSETEVGTIIFNGSSTVYATSSDYRLKDITGAVTGAEAKDFIMALQPKQGTWKSDGSKFVGFLAHELQAVSPSSVSGTKDAVDKNGNPEYQGIQAASSEVMANLIALIQEQQALIQDLTTRLNTLEGN